MAAPRLRKALGQHHLVDGALCADAVAWLAPAGGRVVEVGPGGGVLTERLLAAGARHVLALELDLAWAAELSRRLDDERLDTVVADGVAWPWEASPPGTRVAGNLPYAIATRLVRRLLPLGDRLPRAVFLVQVEVADRLTAAPGSKGYGMLSVLVAAWGRAELLRRVRRGSFRPPPKVDGAFVGLRLGEPLLPRDEMAEFERWLGALFTHRRQSLGRTLRRVWPRAAATAALERLEIDRHTRAQELGARRLAELFEVGRLLQ